MIKKCLRVLRLALIVPIALIAVIVVRIVRPVILIRIGTLTSQRIGHFVLETELMLLEQRCGIKSESRRVTDVYYMPMSVSNQQIERMWRRELRIVPRWIMAPVNRLNEKIPGGQRHVVPSATASAFDVHNLLDSIPPTLAFTEAEESRGSELLRELGLSAGKYVCVIARDAEYCRKVFPASDMSYHDYRNCDIDTYVEGMESLANRGLHVVRMGAIVEKPLVSSHPKVFDYASSPLRSDFADVYLAAKCKFCVSDGLGFYALPAAFRRPNAFVNFSPFHMLYSSRRCDVGITKVFTDKDSRDVVPLRKLRGTGIARLTRVELIDQVGLAVASNSSKEIRDLMIEMNDRLDGTWVETHEDKALQDQFWGMFKDVIGSEGLNIHGEFRARFGAQFLRSHIDWFAS